MLPEGDLGKGQALLLREPSRVLAAYTAREVPALLAEVGEEQACGHYVAGYLAYEAGAAFGLAVKPSDGLPLLWMAVYPPEHVELLPTERWPGPVEKGPGEAGLDLNVSPDEYAAAIGRVRELIAAGDTYQVNYTVRARFRLDVDPLRFFFALVRRQPVPYGAYLDLDEAQILSLSPEQFLRRRGVILESMPMKGTRPRGSSPEEDLDLAYQLVRSAKDRAENLMIVDMVRNDLGRVSQAGSVKVPALYAVEPYRTVWQMTSTVTGRIRREARPLELLAATFPGASITGAPKYHTMEIIAELETEPRGVYTGMIGLFLPVLTQSKTGPQAALKRTDAARPGDGPLPPAVEPGSGPLPPAVEPGGLLPPAVHPAETAETFHSGLSPSSERAEHLAEAARDFTGSGPLPSQSRTRPSGPGGDFTCNVAIRTLVHRAGDFRLGVGGGIVWDSEPKDEYQEALDKAAFALVAGKERWAAPSLVEQASRAAAGLFETLVLRENTAGPRPAGELCRYFDLSRHMARLSTSARALELAFDLQEAERVLLEVAQKTREAVVVRLDLHGDGRISASTRPLPHPHPKPITLLVSPFRTDPYNELLWHKTTARLLYDRERQRAQAHGYEEVLFLNQLGRVTEGAITNLFARFGRQWLTPPVSDGLLPGLWRASFLAQKQAEERSLSLQELLLADEIVIGNSVRGTIPVGEVVVNDLRGLVP